MFLHKKPCAKTSPSNYVAAGLGGVSFETFIKFSGSSDCNMLMSCASMQIFLVYFGFNTLSTGVF
jgi:hypothetical protein